MNKLSHILRFALIVLGVFLLLQSDLLKAQSAAEKTVFHNRGRQSKPPGWGL